MDVYCDGGGWQIDAPRSDEETAAPRAHQFHVVVCLQEWDGGDALPPGATDVARDIATAVVEIGQDPVDQVRVEAVVECSRPHRRPAQRPTPGQRDLSLVIW